MPIQALLVALIVVVLLLAGLAMLKRSGALAPASAAPRFVARTLLQPAERLLLPAPGGGIARPPGAGADGSLAGHWR